MTLEADEGGTRVGYTYEVEVTGKVAAVGGRMLEGATRILIGQFFEAPGGPGGGEPGGGPPGGAPPAHRCPGGAGCCDHWG